MDYYDYRFDCSRGCKVERDDTGLLQVDYKPGCCKLSDFDYLNGLDPEKYREYYEVRFKNTRKVIFCNDSGQQLKAGDLVIVEATNGHDLGIVTLCGPVVLRQMAKRRINPETYQFKKIYRKAKALDIEHWQEAISREYSTMIRSRQLAARLGLKMKIGDVEFQGDGTKAIFYYIADERVDFRQLIKDFAEEFHIRIEMKQIGARQEAGLIGGLGVCGRPLCCSKFISDFKSITTAAARCQDLALNPQKLAGQCSKLKCCINFEASTYIDARKRLPDVREPLDLEDGPAFLVKTDVLMGTMWFSFDKGNMANMFPLSADQVRQIIDLNRHGAKGDPVIESAKGDDTPDFVTAVGDDSITRFDSAGKKRSRGGRSRGRKGDESRGASAKGGGQKGGSDNDGASSGGRKSDSRKSGSSDQKREGRPGRGDGRPRQNGEGAPQFEGGEKGSRQRRSDERRKGSRPNAESGGAASGIIDAAGSNGGSPEGGVSSGGKMRGADNGERRDRRGGDRRGGETERRSREGRDRNEGRENSGNREGGEGRERRSREGRERRDRREGRGGESAPAANHSDESAS